MARAATSGELALFRSDNQSTKLKVYVYNPTAVATARVFAAPVSNDRVRSISVYDGNGGTWDATLDGMTVLVGTTAGAADVGIVRARAGAVDTLLIGETSEIAWAAGQYLTILPEFSLWSRQLSLTAGIWNLDGETAYTDQNKLFNPVPVLGPIVYVGKLSSGTAVISPDASASWVPGGTITAYSWGATGGTVTNGTTATPTITYTTAGHYVISCLVTASNGKTFLGYRAVIIEGTGVTGFEEFALDSCSGEVDAGGWSFTLTVYEDAALARLIRDRALCVIVADDSYGATAQSVGPISGQERVLVAGWIDGESIRTMPEYGTVQFSAKGPAGWGQVVSAWPMAIMHSDGDPVDWMHIKDLDLQKAEWFWATWRGTASRFMDVYPITTWAAPLFDASSGANDLWSQAKAIADKIAGVIACDRYGRMFFDTDLQLVEVADRTSIPIVMDVTKEDWRDEISVERRLSLPVALLETGSIVKSGSSWGAVLSRAPGNAMHRTGTLKSRFNMLFTSQAHANTVTGLMAGKENNPYQPVKLALAANNRLIDIVPAQYLTLSLAAADNVSGLVWTAKRLIPRSVEYQHRLPSAALLVDVTCEVETLPELSVEMLPPAVPDIGLPGLPDIDVDFPLIPDTQGWTVGEPYNPPDLPPGDGTCYSDYTASENGPHNLGVAGVRETTITIPYRFGMRTSSHEHPTRYSLKAKFQARTADGGWVDTDDDVFYNVKAICVNNAGADVEVVGTHDAVTTPDYRTGYFNFGYPNGMTTRAIILEIDPAGLMRPDTILFSADYANASDVWGTQEWWLNGAGIRAAWKGMQFWWGSDAYNLARLIHVNPVPPTGENWRDRHVLFRVEAVEASDDTTPPLRVSHHGIGLWDSIREDDTNVMPIEGFYQHVVIPSNGSSAAFWFPWSTGIPWGTYEFSSVFNLYVDMRFAPMWRIVIQSFCLWDICPPSV